MPITPRQIILKIHLYLGIVAALFLLILSATGTVIAFEHDIERWVHPELWMVTPGRVVMGVRLPANPKAVFTITLRTPADFSVGGAVPIPIYVDPYSGHPVQVQDIFAESPGYRIVRLNRAIHTGDLWGLPGNILMSLSSAALGLMVLTGLIIRLKKLAE